MCFKCALFSSLMGRFFDHSFSPMSIFRESWWVQSCWQSFPTQDVSYSFGGHHATLHQLHLPPSNLVPPPSFYYQPKHIFVLDRILFTQALAIAPHLFSSGFSGMVFEHLSGCFILENPFSWFSKLFQVVAIVVCGDIPRLVASMLGVSKLLAMAKNIGGLCPIAIGKVFFWLISHSIVL